MFNLSECPAKRDPELWQWIDAEAKRQEQNIELIASENYASPAVMAAQGSCLTNKYAEGYPGKRYYGGCEFVDEVERLAIERAKKLFCEPAGVEMAVNVQPHSGAQANSAVFFAVLKPGDTFMGLSLADYDEVERLAKENKPKLIVTGASAYSLKIDFKRFAEIAHSVGALLMVDMAHYAGLIAAGVYPSPFGHADIVTTTTHKTLRGPRGGMIFVRPDLEKAINSAVFPGMQGGPLMHVIAAKAVALGEALQPEYKTYQEQVMKNAHVMAEQLMARGLRIVSGRTESHVMLVDLRPLKITGKTAETVLHSVGITVNKNAIPHDPEKPFVTSGIRLGSPAMTTRGFKEDEARLTANLIVDVLEAPEDQAVLDRVRGEVAKLTAKFPVYVHD